MKSALVRAARPLMMLVVAWGASAQELVIEGTGDGVDVLKPLAYAATAKIGSGRILIPPSIGSGGGIAKVIDGSVELARSARGLSADEARRGLVSQSVMKIPVAIIVNRDAGVVELSSAQAVKIFGGEVTNWREFGGNDLRIRVLTREDNDSSRLTLHGTFPGWAGRPVTAKARLISTSTQDMIAAIRQTPGGIGYAPNSKWLGDQVRVLKIDGKDVRSPEYPSANEIWLVWHRDRLSEQSRHFLDVVNSPEGAAIIKDQGAVLPN